MKKKKYLILFNLETDLESKVLAASHDWVSEFSNHFDHVNVFSTHLGKTALPSNVNATEIGGGSLSARIKGVGRLLKIIPFLLLNRSKVVVFYHMTTYPAIILGPTLRAFGIKQGLWYSHSVPSLSFRIASFFVDRLYSSSPEALPIESSKALFIGHGLNVERFKSNLDLGSERRCAVVSVGRYARIKNFERMLELSDRFPHIEFTIVGPEGEVGYKTKLVEHFLANSSNINLGTEISYENIPTELRKFRYFFSGTPKSVDKAAIEGAMCGCFILTQNNATLKVTGMEKVWEQLGIECPIEIADQILELEANRDRHALLQKLLISTSISNNDLARLAFRVKESLLCL